MKIKGSKVCIRFIALLLCTIMIISIVPAFAATTVSRYDFSTVDDLNKYDTYPKKIASGTSDDSSLPIGTEYVSAAMYNQIDRTRPISDFRYSAFLRNADEVQNYIFFNLSDRTVSKNMPESVLTIYADPGVEFKLYDADGIEIADQNGYIVSTAGTYFNKSTDNGHNVFYFELQGKKVGTSSTSISFTAPQTDVPVHYSFWFGAPLLVSGTKTSKLMLDARKPSTTSSTYNVSFSFSGSMANRTWIDSITVNKTYFSGKDSCSTIYLSLLYPGISYAERENILSTGNATYQANLNHNVAYLANGKYAFQLTGVSWGYNTYGTEIDYKANVILRYYQPFGY